MEQNVTSWGRKIYLLIVSITTLLLVNFLFLAYTPMITRKKFYYEYISNKSMEQVDILHNPKHMSSSDFSTIVWHLVPENANSSDEWTILICSSFYDHRIEKVVVLLASDAAGLLKVNSSVHPKFICQIFFATNNDSQEMKIEIEGYFYTSYIFYCPLPSQNFTFSNTKSRLSIRRSDQNFNTDVNWTIPIENLMERKAEIKPKTLALCVGIMFGYQNWLILLQYIEFHRMQGVEKFIFFYHDLYWSTVEIFRWYKRYYDFIETVYWDPTHYVCQDDYRCQLLRDNFCSYSLMYKYKFVGNSDFDELFFPAKGRLVDLLHSADKTNRGSFTFCTKFHQILKNDIPQWNYTNFEDILANFSTFLPLYHFNNVSTMAGDTFTPKTITKPQTVLKRWVHYVSEHIDGSYTYTFEENEGFLRHFKIRLWWGDWADITDGEVKYKIVDPFVEVEPSLINILTERITMVVKNITTFLSNETLVLPL